MEQALSQALLDSGACACGSVDVGMLRGQMDAAGLAQAYHRTPGLRGLLCAAYPYDGSPSAGNLSLYARGQDYHAVLRQRLTQAAQALCLRYPGQRFDFWADASPFPEVYAAACAGLGVVGRNGLLITPRHGSFVFLGFLATDLPGLDEGSPPQSCVGCNACLRACPGGALHTGGLDAARCLSALTQRRGALSEEEEALVRRGGLIWGCDRCQLVCPMNGAAARGGLPEFAPTRASLSQADTAMGDRAFRSHFSGCAFTWRGVQPLRRNLALVENQPKQEDSHA